MRTTWQRHNQHENRIIPKCDVIQTSAWEYRSTCWMLVNVSITVPRESVKDISFAVAYYQWHRILWILFAIKMLLNRNYVHSFQSIQRREIEHYLTFFLFIRFSSGFFLVCDKIERMRRKKSHKKLRWRNVCGMVYTTEKSMQPQTKNEILSDSNMKMENIEMNPFYRFWGKQSIDFCQEQWAHNPSDNHSEFSINNNHPE